jgi:glutamate synthase (NADPH/NADH) small chain
LATGFDAELSPEMLEQLEQLSAKSVLRPDQKTPIKNVFTAGDLINGASYVATAIASGRSAAEKIDQYLKKTANA